MKKSGKITGLETQIKGLEEEYQKTLARKRRIENIGMSSDVGKKAKEEVTKVLSRTIDGLFDQISTLQGDLEIATIEFLSSAEADGDETEKK